MLCKVVLGMGCAVMCAALRLEKLRDDTDLKTLGGVLHDKVDGYDNDNDRG